MLSIFPCFLITTFMATQTYLASKTSLEALVNRGLELRGKGRVTAARTMLLWPTEQAPSQFSRAAHQLNVDPRYKPHML
ncbi:uncharacterized protein BJ212DRAFT_1402681 [Suillus subaureus]|uniref:Uncharacterized protein n=1 Tax=Suillus subaureus TaxID=48587 RepID=A0A9P7DNA0_9AGAM|nr:uncharacterized protein BJ212DRAFT_1402681 [Suillus subaureus]KAG1799084.1 hypothetical protein BJ212DRAFT_1402681 [Suillus subaureus]